MFKDRLREARLNQGLTQAQLAQQIGVVNSTIASYETGRSDPDMKRLVMLVGALRVDVDYLLQDEMHIMNHTKRPVSCDALTIAQQYDELDDHGKYLVDTITGIEHARRYPRGSEQAKERNSAQSNRFFRPIFETSTDD